MIQTLLERWSALSERERRGVLAGSLLLLAVLLWAFAYDPAARGRARLLAERASWQTDLARMDALVASARQLGAVNVGDVPSLQSSLEPIEVSVRAAGFAAQLTSLKATNDLIELRLTGVPVAAALPWLETTVRESRLHVVELSIERLGPPASAGTVSLRVVLDRPGRPR